MLITAYNNKIVINDITDALLIDLTKKLAYTDKAKEFQLKKLENSHWAAAATIQQLRKEVHCTVLKKLNKTDVEIPPGFFHLLDRNQLVDVDNRHITGCLEQDYEWRFKPYGLRDYQEEAVSAMMKHRRGLIELATGLGKTLTTIHYIKRKGGKTLIVCPGTSIANGFFSELVTAFGKEEVGFYGAGKKNIKNITVGIAASVTRNIGLFKDFGFKTVVFDETHKVAASTFTAIATGLGDVENLFGLTGTSYRNDGKDILIEAAVGHSIVIKDTVWGVKNEWLAEPHIYIRDVPTLGRDYPSDKLKNYKTHVLKSHEMNTRLIADIKGLRSKGLSVLVLVNEVAHGTMLSEEVGCDFAHGKNKNNSELLDKLNNGDIGLLIATSKLFGEGTDTRRVDALVMAAFSAAKSVVIQQIGRGLRKYGKKTKVIIFDYCPTGSKMLTRHARLRKKYYKEFTQHVTSLK